MSDSTIPSRPSGQSLKEIALRVGGPIDPQTPPTDGERRLDTVRPVSLSTAPPAAPPSHKLRELAQLCEEVESRIQRGSIPDDQPPVPDEPRGKVSVIPMLGGAIVGLVVIVFAVMSALRTKPPATPSSTVPTEGLAPSAAATAADAPSAAKQVSRSREEPTGAFIADPSLLPAVGDLAAPSPRSRALPVAPSARAEQAALPAPDASASAEIVSTAHVVDTAETAAPSQAEPDADPSEIADGSSGSAPAHPGAAPDTSARSASVDSIPSNGQVQAALSKVWDAARICVTGLEGPSRASVTFASSGNVSAISVSGPAAGTLAEGCIRSALSRAQLPPFSNDTFTVGLTLRP